MATGYWDGANNGLWSAVANWNTTLSGAVNVTVVPGVADVAHFNNNAVVTVRDIYLNGSRSVGQIAFNSNNRGTTLKGGTSVTPAANTLTLGSSGINASGDSAYFFVTDANTTVALTSAATPFTIPSTNASYVSGPMTGTGFGINKQSGGHLVFNGAGKTYTGETRVSGGVLFLFTTLSTPSAGTTALTVDSGATVSCNTTNVYGTATNNYLWNIAGSVNSDSGYQWLPIGATLTNGTLGGSSASALGAFHVASGRTSTITGYGTISGSVGLIGGLTTSVTTGQTLTVSGAIGTASANTGSLTKNGAGTLVLSAFNAFTGGTTVNAGTLTLNAGSDSGSSPCVRGTLTVKSGATVNLTAQNAINGDATPLSVVVEAGGNFNFGSDSLYQTFCKSFTIQGATITGTKNTGYVLGSNTASSLIIASGTNTWIAGPFVFLNNTQGIQVASGTTTWSGKIVDIGDARDSNIIKSGAGTLTLTGANTFTKGFTLSEGGLTIGNDSALGTGTLTLTNGSIDVVGARSITNALAITGSWTFTGSNTLTQSVGAIPLTQSPSQITVSASTLTLGGVISGAHELAKLGPGTLALTGANTFTGGAVINVGTVNLGVARVGTTSGPLGASGTISLGGGTLQYSAANQHDYSSRFSTAANQQYRCDTNGQNVTWATALTSSGGFLVKGGSGTLTLLGNNTYTSNSTLGLGTVNVGSLQTGGAGPLGNLASASIFMVGGTLQYSSSNNFDYSPYFSADGYFNVDTNNQSVTWASNLTENDPLMFASTLAKGGAGTLTLSGTNTYSGGTTVSQGTLKAGNISALGTGTASVASGATLAALASIGGKLNIGGTLTNSGGTLRIGGS